MMLTVGLWQRRGTVRPSSTRSVLLLAFLLTQLTSASIYLKLWQDEADCDCDSAADPRCDDDGSGTGNRICGVDCESSGSGPAPAGDSNHDKWIDVLSIDWGAQQRSTSSGEHMFTSSRRRRGSVVVDDMRLTVEYEKCAVKLQESALKGKVFPKVEIDVTSCYTCPQRPFPANNVCDVSGQETDDTARATYLKYELKNVMVTSYSVHHKGQGEECPASGNDEAGPPTFVIGNNFDDIKIEYTGYDSEGNKGGNAETTWKVEKGEKLRARE